MTETGEMMRDDLFNVEDVGSVCTLFIIYHLLFSLGYCLRVRGISKLFRHILLLLTCDYFVVRAVFI